MVDTKQTARAFALQIYADQQAGKFVAEAAKPLADYLEALREPDFATSIAETIKEESLGGAACGWQPCSGCYDTEDGRPTARYQHSKMFGCDIGSGCSECGGLGVVWMHYSAEDLEDMASDVSPAPRPEMERELAEARNHVAELELERDRFATENLALAADNARLEKVLRELETKAVGQKDYFNAKQSKFPSLEEFTDEDGYLSLPDDISPLLSHASANGRYSEADWWLSTIRATIDAALSGASIPAPDKAGSKMEPVSIDYLRGQIGEILVLELDAKEDGRALSQAVERILALVAASSAPDKAEARREDADFPTSVCTAWEDCKHDGVCHDPAQCAPARREGE